MLYLLFVFGDVTLSHSETFYCDGDVTVYVILKHFVWFFGDVTLSHSETIYSDGDVTVYN